MGVARRLLVLTLPGCLATAARAQEGRTFFRAGDMRRIQWVRPWDEASKTAAARGRLLVVKPILGGSNTPDPDGVPCGGKKDCEGSW